MTDIYRVAFFGHRRIYNIREIEEKLVPILNELILTKEYVEFYIGRNGEFDEFAAAVIKRVQKQLDRGNSTLILTLPYTVKDIEYYAEYYDEIVIPDVVGNAHPKGAITLRNKWGAEICDLIICYIEREEGGAYSAVKYAKKLKKELLILEVTRILKMRKISKRKALIKLRKIRKNGYKIDSRTEKNLRIDMVKSWRRLAFHILVYLSANTDILAANNNQEIYDKVRDIQIKHHQRSSSESSYEDMGRTVDFLVELNIKYDDGLDYFVEQETMELYRPNTVHDSKWKERMVLEMFFYTTSPEIYTKTIYESADGVLLPRINSKLGR